MSASRKLLLPNIGLGKEKQLIIENLSLLITSGRGVASSLEAIKRGLRSRRLKKVIAWVYEDVQNGIPLWKSLAATGLFASHVVSLIRVGEESGNLSRNLRALSIQTQKDAVFHARVRSALMYPVFVLVIAFVVGITISWFILPRLASVFDQFTGITLPLATQLLIAVGAFFQAHGIWFVPTAVILFFLTISILFFVPETKFIGQWILFHIPGIRGLLRTIETARFGTTLGVLLESGIPVVSALESLERATDFPVYERLYGYLATSVEAGNSFERSFATYKADHLIEPAIQEMIVTGEQSGSLSSTLKRIGETFEEKSTTATKDLSVILEPIMLLIVWVVVVVVALAVVLPIYGLLDGLDQSQTPTTSVVQDTSREVPPAPIEPPREFAELIITDDAAPSLRVREDAGATGRVITTVVPGETFTYGDIENGWYEIELPALDTTGWVSSDFVEEL